MEESGMLQGILDDRGKYIYITEEEIESLLRCVENKGKFTKSEMITEFSKHVRLEPKDARWFCRSLHLWLPTGFG